MAGETPQKAPADNQAQEAMNRVFAPHEKGGKMETEYKVEPLSPEEMERKVGTNVKEISGAAKGKFKPIMEQAKDAIKQNSKDHKLSHGDSQGFDIDGVQYVYLRDESQKTLANKDRLFKKV
jgi:hypothetical protein